MDYKLRIKKKSYNLKIKSSEGEQNISGYPKILPATYTFLPLEVQIKERTENE